VEKRFAYSTAGLPEKGFSNIVQSIPIIPSTFVVILEEIYSCTQNFRPFITSVERLTRVLKKSK